ncbi:cyclase [Deinococcus metallilatus]|uniref:Cyclase n=2 Tax=Deinococcus TaxID=1298 RepID=A0AAJ5JXB5_9DEIO|nr:SRPBCC family protein [Deinococcus metallilatus]MBB5297318.1 putative membrane protein [Deinococcus metallilatus]QBY10096.1 cyclase [Deinococcus metallilatus]RXJ08256.1 cyclase [Deinococcus metallilatus]TLK21163.1 cyclase [Deinococcus metallilatus]GMA17118.1 cyclase [Deinococcus metallilatus]
MSANMDNSNSKEDSKSMDQGRLISGAAGGALLLLGLRKRGVLGLGMAAVGGYLAYRAATGNDPVMAAAGLSGNAAAAKPIFVEHSVVIDRPAQLVYAYWRNLENLPRIMSHLESVTVLDERRSRWVAKAPLGTHVEWEAEIVNDKPGERIGWHSLPGATVDNAGSVQFESLPNGGTRVHVALSYRPPAGALGAAVAKLFGEEPSQQIADDLQNFKQTFEGANPQA